MVAVKCGLGGRDVALMVSAVLVSARCDREPARRSPCMARARDDLSSLEEDAAAFLKHTVTHARRTDDSCKRIPVQVQLFVRDSFVDSID
jgi:hypothetical protein